MASMLKKIAFYAMRSIKSKVFRDYLTSVIANRIGKREPFEGTSAFIKSEQALMLQSIRRDGFVELDNPLSHNKIEEIIAFSKSLKCFDPFHRDYGEFSFKDVPSVTHVANFKRSNLVTNPTIMAIANDPGVLNLVQEYLGAKPTISNVNMWWSIGGHDQAEDAQLFHRDVDDFKFCKLFIYLTDVDAESGPHTYVRTSAASSKLLKIRRYQDEEVEAVFGKENVIEFTRPKGSAFIVDTYGFHKGLLPKSKNRLLLQIQYSLNPIGIETYTPIALSHYNYDKYTNRLLIQ